MTRQDMQSSKRKITIFEMVRSITQPQGSVVVAGVHNDEVGIGLVNKVSRLPTLACGTWS
jgi:hypothetical protein